MHEPISGLDDLRRVVALYRERAEIARADADAYDAAADIVASAIEATKAAGELARSGEVGAAAAADIAAAIIAATDAAGE